MNKTVTFFFSKLTKFLDFVDLHIILYPPHVSYDICIYHLFSS